MNYITDDGGNAINLLQKAYINGRINFIMKVRQISSEFDIFFFRQAQKEK